MLLDDTDGIKVAALRYLREKSLLDERSAEDRSDEHPERGAPEGSAGLALDQPFDVTVR